MELHDKIRHLYYNFNKSGRQIAQELSISCQTVAKALVNPIVPAYTLSKPRPSPQLGSFKSKINELLGENKKLPRKQHYTAHKIFQLLQKEGYCGSESSVQNYVVQLRKDQRRPQTFLPLEFDPGQEAQVDWGVAVAVVAGIRQNVQIFVMRLNYSRRSFVLAFPSQKQEAFFEGHVRAFQHFGGVLRRLSYDNLATAVKIVAQGRVREGGALLQGLLVCDQCGYFMHVAYKPATVYFCSAEQKRLQSPSCTYLSRQVSARLEQLVVESFFEALRPAQLDALQGVLAAQEAERQSLLQIWQERVKRTRYAVQLAERQYNAVDPDNRLVAGELERRWETALQQLQQTQEEYTWFEINNQLPTIPVDLAEKFREISKTLPELWGTGQLSNVEKKELLRCLIAQVIVHWRSSDTIEVRIVWISGHYSVLERRPPVHKLQDLTNWQEIAARVTSLWQEGLSERGIAEQMTQEGYRSSHLDYVSEQTVRKIRLDNQRAAPASDFLKAPSLPGELAVNEFAARYGFEQIWLYRQIENKRLGAEYVNRHPRSRTYLIKEDLEVIEKLRILWERKEGWKIGREQH